MSVLAGPFAIAATLLLIGGALKVIRPDDTTGALRALGLPSRPSLVRMGAGAEAVIGAGALAFGDRAFAAAVALSYLGFGVFVAVALAKQLPIASCGCFGRSDTPPTITHLVVNGCAALVAAGVALDPGVGLTRVVADQPLAGIPFLLLVATGSSLAFLALTALPRARTPAGAGRDQPSPASADRGDAGSYDFAALRSLGTRNSAMRS